MFFEVYPTYFYRKSLKWQENYKRDGIHTELYRLITSNSTISDEGFL